MKIAAVAWLAFAPGVFLSACDSGPERPDAVAAPTAPVAASASVPVRNNDAVQAVLQSSGRPVARLAFVIDSAPAPGKPFTLQLQVAAGESVPELALTAESTQLIVAPATATLALAGGEAVLEHELIVTAPKAGLLDLSVRLKAGDAPETVYAIPVLVAPAEG